MRKLAILLGIMAISLLAQAQDKNISQQKEQLVINKQMIEKFNNADYQENQVSIYDLMTLYSFDDIKLITQAYTTGKIEILDYASINTYIESESKNNQQIILKSETDIVAQNNTR